MSEKCTSKTASGEPCGAWPIRGGTQCALHSDPERAAKMGSRHGRKAVLPPDTDAPPMEPPKTAGDVRDAIAQVMSDVRSCRLDTKIASTLGYLASVLLKSIEVADVEGRLAALESVLGAGVQERPPRS